MQAMERTELDNGRGRAVLDSLHHFERQQRRRVHRGVECRVVLLARQELAIVQQ